MAQVRLFCGAARSGRARHLDNLMRAHWGRAVLLVPTRQYARRRLEKLILEAGLDGAWGQPVCAFDDFVADMLRANGVEADPIHDVERRLLIEHAVARLGEQGALDAIGPAAQTRGFISHVMHVIAQLKQAAIDPAEFRARVAQRKNHVPLDTAVADIYAAYQEALLEAGVYDLQGLFWEANLLCRRERPAALADIDVLLLDGFDDFTPSEFRLIEALEQHVDLLELGLNYDTGPDRQDLYETPARTARRIRKQFDVEEHFFEEEPPRTFAEFASCNIFGRNKAPLPEGLHRNIEILSCLDFVQEVETVGRRVKTLLLDEGVRADEIAVVYRNLGDVAGTLRAVFGEFGIPVRIVREPALTESAVCAFLMSVLEATESWERGAVVDVLTAPWFYSGDSTLNSGGSENQDQRPRTTELSILSPEYVAAFPVLSRMAQVVAGYEEWVQRLEQFIGRLGSGTGEDVERLVHRMPEAVKAAEALLANVRLLDGLGRTLPATATPANFARALDGLIDALCIDRAIENHSVKEVREPESAALAALRNLLGTVALWDERDTAPESRTAFVSRLRQALGEKLFPYLQAQEGVVCLDAASVRHLRFDYVFFGGVNEGDTPSPPLVSSIYSEDDLDSLSRAGIKLDGKRVHSARELLLFHHVLDVPRKHLCITWHTLSRRGREKLPSPYIADLLELFPNEAIQQAILQANAFVPSPEKAASWRDLRNAAFAGEMGTVPYRGLAWDSPHFASARVGAEIETARHNATPFGAYDGVLTEPDLIAQIAQRFGDSHVFSVKQIETYTACPFRFFVECLLEVAEAEIPVAEFDARVRGTILHAILQAFHEIYRGVPTSEIPEEAARETMTAVVAEQFGAKVWRSATAPRGVLAVEHKRLDTILERYLQIERELDESQWNPGHFEVAFGPAHGESADPLTNDDPFELETPAGIVRFAGRIDRIDVSDNQARIIDYKTSVRVRLKDIQEGRSIQLSIYALALEGLLMPGTACTEALFLEPGRDKRREGLGRNARKLRWGEREQIARETVATAVSAIRAGRFPPAPSDKDACAYCPAKGICRYEQGRVERKERTAGE